MTFCPEKCIFGRFTNLSIGAATINVGPNAGACRARVAPSRKKKSSGPTPGASNLNQKSIFEDFDNFWRYMPIKWLSERANGSKNEPGIGFENPGVDPSSSPSLTQT